MLRTPIIWLSKAEWARRVFSLWGPAQSLARRFVAGETLESAVGVVRQLNAQGIIASLDVLGENTTNEAEAGAAVSQILDMIAAVTSTGVQANISIKLSQIGMALDPELCQRNLVRILEAARPAGIFVRIDMEDSPFTTLTLDIYRAVRTAGFDIVGVVIQAYLYRSQTDLERLCSLQTRVRLCKGAYREPASAAFPCKIDVDQNYDRLAGYLLEQAKSTGMTGTPDGRIPPLVAIATHDPLRIAYVRRWVEEHALPPGTVEFQMLYGIRRDLQVQLVRAGFPVRVYVPFGTHWYPYLMRRLAERPANFWFILKNYFKA